MELVKAMKLPFITSNNRKKNNHNKCNKKKNNGMIVVNDESQTTRSTKSSKPRSSAVSSIFGVDGGLLEDISRSSGLSAPYDIVVLYEDGIEYISKSLYSKALTRLEKALELALRNTNMKHQYCSTNSYTDNNADNIDEVVSVIKLEIGKVLYHFGQYRQSATMFLAARELLQCGNDDNDNSGVINVLKEVANHEESSNNNGYDDNDSNSSTISYYEAVIRMGIILLGQKHMDVAVANHALADLYCDEEKFHKATPYLKAALRGYLSITSDNNGNGHGKGDEDSPEISSILFKLGRVNYETDKYKSALKYFASSLTMDQRLYGPTHHCLAHTYLLLGQIHLNTSRLEEAITHLSKALSLLSFNNPNHHTDLASILLRIGIAYIRQRDYASAEQVYNQRLALQKTIYATTYTSTNNHYTTENTKSNTNINNSTTHIADTYKQLADIYMSRKHYEKAVHAYLQLLNLKRNLLGKEHYNIALLLIHIADIYQYNLHALTSAITVYQEALRILQLHQHQQHQHQRRLLLIKTTMHNNNNHKEEKDIGRTIYDIQHKLAHILGKTGIIDNTDTDTDTNYQDNSSTSLNTMIQGNISGDISSTSITCSYFSLRSDNTSI